MRASSRRFCLTPKGEFYLIGYGSRYKSRLLPAAGVHDDIFANAILIESNGKQIFIFNADFIEFEESSCNELKELLHQKYGLDHNLIFFSATHNHQSVMSYHKTWKTGVFSQEYYDFLVSTVESAYQQCRDSLTKSEAYYGVGEVIGYYGSREHFGEKADNDVILVEFKNGDSVVAAICNYATHSTIIDPENNLLTGDFAGALCRRIYEDRGYYPAMVVGAAGDSSNRAFRKGVDYDELNRTVIGVAEQIKKIKVDQKIEIEFEYDNFITYRVNYEPKDDADFLNTKIKELEQKLTIATDFQSKKLYGDAINTYRTKLKMKKIDITLSSSIVKMKDLQIISIPGELGSTLGLELKTFSKAKCCLIFGYTNGHFHYILQPELFKDTPRAIAGRYRIVDVIGYMNEIKAAM